MGFTFAIAGPGPEGFMDVLRAYIERMIKQTEEDLVFQRKTDPADEWMKFLEGKLHAMRLILAQMEDIRKKDEQLH